MEKKEYKFSNGLECYQSEFTLKKNIRLAEILKKHFIEAEQKNISSTNILNALTDESFAVDLLSLILNIPEEKKSLLLDLTNAELEEVITDFFTLNPLFKKQLMSLGSRLASSIPTLTT